MKVRTLIVSASLVFAVAAILFSLKSTGSAQQSAALTGEPCKPHAVADSLCTRCNPELIPMFKENHDWCAGHNVPESQCDLCSHSPLNKQVQQEPIEEVQASDRKDLHVVGGLDWCAEHRVSESECTNCHPELIQSFKEKFDWCGGHDIPESHCYLCNRGLTFPQEAEYKRLKQESKTSVNIESLTIGNLDWCAEHRVPESECTKCNPELIQSFKEKFDWCGGHAVPESHCYLCNRGLTFPQEAEYKRLKQESEGRKNDKPRTSIFRSNSEYCATNDAIIQLASVQTADRSGLVFGEVAEVPSQEIIEAVGETEFATTTSTIVTSLTTGTLVEWAVRPGDRVFKGQVLAWLESVEVAALRADYFHSKAIRDLAETTYQRKEELTKEGLASKKEILEAKSELAKARADLQRTISILSAIGFTAEEIANEGDVQTSLLPVRSRRPGTLIEYQADPGSILSPGQPLAQIADVANLWVTAQVHEKDLPKIKMGQLAMVASDGNLFQKTKGKVIWISDAINPLTRTVPVRIEIANNESRLRAKQYVQIALEYGPLNNQYLVPETAVQWEGCCNVVFVVETPDRIRPRKVTVEYGTNNAYAVTGVMQGERIVTRGSYILKTELMKEGIGAGCCPVGV